MSTATCILINPFLILFLFFHLSSIHSPLFVTLIPVLSTAITMSSFSGFMFGSRFIFILSTLHQIVVKSGTVSGVSLYELTSFLESPLIDGMEVGTHVRWRAAISRNSDSESEGLPFLCSFSLALLASSVKNQNQTTFHLV